LSSAVLLFSSGSAAPGFTTSVAWYMPVLAGACIACLAWAMLSGAGAESDSDVGRGVDSCCAACGGAIHSAWRLCPHCGERFPTEGSQ
jgi:hypothetical protein